MDLNIIIRPARQGDAPIFQQLENDAGMLFRKIPAVASIADGENLPIDRYQFLIRQGVSWASDSQGGLCIGFLCASREGDAFHIWEMAVAQAFQRRGIGRCLIQRTIEAARADAMREITLTTFRDVPWNAPFYYGCGFREVAGDDAGQRLLSCLREEGQRGLPSELRCAMRLNL